MKRRKPKYQGRRCECPPPTGPLDPSLETSAPPLWSQGDCLVPASTAASPCEPSASGKESEVGPLLLPVPHPSPTPTLWTGEKKRGQEPSHLCSLLSPIACLILFTAKYGAADDPGQRLYQCPDPALLSTQGRQGFALVITVALTR